MKTAIQQVIAALNAVHVKLPDITGAKLEYWKAGARAAIIDYNKALDQLVAAAPSPADAQPVVPGETVNVRLLEAAYQVALMINASEKQIKWFGNRFIKLQEAIASAEQQQAGQQLSIEADTFHGDNARLVSCIESLIWMNDKGALVPHGIGDHARTLLLASAARLSIAGNERQLSDDEPLARATVKHLGPEALTGGQLSPAEIFERGFRAGIAAHEAKINGA